MAVAFRVRRPARGGAVVECRVDRLDKALRVARQVQRRTGRVVRVERKVAHGWETALELAPPVKSAVEGLLARGSSPRVQDAAGRKGRVVSYAALTRECWVTWADTTGKEKVPVDSLTPR